MIKLLKLIEATDIKSLIEPYIDLPLECDGLTRVISYLLKKNNIKHKICTGYISYKNKKIFHWWIKLNDRKYIDYRAQMWLGKSKDIPHGIFDPKDYPLVIYNCEEQKDLHIPEIIFQVLVN